MTAQIPLPDIAKDAADHIPLSLEKVGMSGISVPLTVPTSNGAQAVSALASIYVDLTDPMAKGIHMSRLYQALHIQLTEQPLSIEKVTTVLQDCLQSHNAISSSCQIRLRFSLPLERPALLSDQRGWKEYPVEINCQITPEGTQTELQVTVPYSSTCPCSAALSRQLLAEAFIEKFSDQTPDQTEIAEWLKSSGGSVATPHSQRSLAIVRVRLNKDETTFAIESLIDQIENALQTPVQTAVKRIDEQEFARLNGTNLMFCEDAARRLKRLLNAGNYSDFVLTVEHQESLHAHNAVAKADKGVINGFSASNFWPETI